MSEVKRNCQLNDCHRAASTFCYCCNKSICTHHFTEHIDGVRRQVDPLANEINIMMEKIENLTIEQLIEIPLVKLHQWKCDMHRLVDEIFLSKNKEIEDMVKKNEEKLIEYKIQQRENIMKIQKDVKQLLEDGDATFQQIEILKKELARIEECQTMFQKNFLSIDTQVLEHGFVTISSNLNKSSVNPNIQLLPLQFSSKFLFIFVCVKLFVMFKVLTTTNVSVNPTFDPSTFRPVGFQAAYPMNPPGLNVVSFGAGSTTTEFGEFPFSVGPPVLGNNPFSTGNESTNRRPVIKAKRRDKP
jgi:hypothetical protein